MVTHQNCVYPKGNLKGRWVDDFVGADTVLFLSLGAGQTGFIQFVAIH